MPNEPLQMADLARVPDGTPSIVGPIDQPGPDERYPMGMRMRLEEQEIAKLGLSDVQPGQRVYFQGFADVVAVEQDEGGDGIQIQPTRMGAKVEGTESSQAAVIYPDGQP